MTNKWQFKAVQRMDLGSDSNHGISLSSQKSNAGTNGTAVTASGMPPLQKGWVYSRLFACAVDPSMHATRVSSQRMLAAAAL